MKNPLLFKMNLQLFGDPMFNTEAMMNVLSPPEPAAPAPETPLDPAPAPAPSEPQPTPPPVAPPFDVDAFAAKLQESIANGLANSQPQPQSPQAAPEPTPEEVEAINAKLRDEMLDNPMAFLEKYGEDIKTKLTAEFDSRLKPYEEQAQNAQKSQQIAEALAQFKTDNPDFDDHLDLISEYVAQRPHREEDPDFLADAYNYAKAKKAQAPNDDEFISKAAQDDRVKQQVINEYLKNIRGGQPPAIISNVGATPVITPPNDTPKNFKDAGKMARQMFAQNGN